MKEPARHKRIRSVVIAAFLRRRMFFLSFMLFVIVKKIVIMGMNRAKSGENSVRYTCMSAIIKTACPAKAAAKNEKGAICFE